MFLLTVHASERGNGISLGVHIVCVYSGTSNADTIGTYRKCPD